jgi:hypothetical protein
MHSQPPPKGSLEDLFRHHLLESEAAAVPPRPLVWEHIDNSLLLAQNEKYRRRLLVHRWGIAASLLLATLAGGGWWHSQQVATATLASANARHEAARRAVAGAVAPAPGALTTIPATTTATLAQNEAGATGTAASSNFNSGTGFGPADRATGRPAAGSRLLASANAVNANGQRSHQQPSTSGVAERTHVGTATPLAYGAGWPEGAGAASGVAATHTSPLSSSTPIAIAGTTTFSAASNAAFSPARQLGTGAETGAADAPGAADALATTEATSRAAGENLLAGRLAALALAAPAGLPTALAPKDLPLAAPTELRRWRYGAEYALMAFQPNIDFNRSSGEYNSALGFNTVSLTRAAAAEYRANLRPGLGQRLTLRATRWLGGHWSLSTGLEVAQQRAYSATSAAFTGEQLADAASFSASLPSTSPNSSYAPRELRESSFRYRSVGIPIELQYDTQTKAGVSFYGRIGAIVSSLLNVRSEVAGNAEATRTYTAFSASSPYRRLTALLRGSAGVRYRPAGRGWGLHAGPTAEAGVQSLNAETDRSFMQQQRPYSVGLEAGFEFGGSLQPVPATN